MQALVDVIIGKLKKCIHCNTLVIVLLTLFSNLIVDKCILYIVSALNKLFFKQI